MRCSCCVRRWPAKTMEQSPLIQVGFSTNLARLIESAPDRYSDLSGMDLVKKKVRLLTVMAGNFAAKQA